MVDEVLSSFQGVEQLHVALTLHCSLFERFCTAMQPTLAAATWLVHLALTISPIFWLPKCGINTMSLYLISADISLTLVHTSGTAQVASTLRIDANAS